MDCVSFYGYFWSFLVIMDVNTEPKITEEILKTNLSPKPNDFLLGDGDWLIKKITYKSPGIMVYHNRVEYIIIGKYTGVETYDKALDDVKKAMIDLSTAKSEYLRIFEEIKKLEAKSK